MNRILRPLRPVCSAALAAALALAGCAGNDMPPDGDDDGDGLTNAEEAAGWEVVVYGARDEARRYHVQPRPDLADSDADGLDDAEEQARGLDPLKADTDGDGLDDHFEVHVLGSRADDVDSDDDAGDDPRFWDGAEYERNESSPALADTDGDGFDDRYEDVELGTDPRIADLPQLELTVESVPEIGLNTTLTNGESRSFSVSQATTRSVSVSHGESRTNSESFSLAVGFGLEAGWAGGIHVVAKFNTEMTTTRQVSLTTDRSYTEEASAQVAEARDRAESRQLTFESGYVAFPVTLANTGRVAFTVRNASMTLLHRDRRNPWHRRALAHIETADPRTQFPARTLGPGETHSSVYFRRDTLGWDDAVALMEDPRGLELEVSGFELVDADGRAFGHDATVRRGRTGMVIIDHGPTVDIPSTQAILATNMRYDPATGEPTGLLLVEGLREWLGKDVQIQRVPGADGRPVTVLAGLEGHTAPGSMHDPGAIGRWNVLRVREGVASAVLDDFETLRLMPGDAIHLVYDEDKDGDGLGVRTEVRLGTSDEAVDTDGDGLADGDEVLHGWSPEDPRPTHAVSDPTRADTDEDGLDDAAEQQAGTDAFDPDTDGDSLVDGLDLRPLEVDEFTLDGLDARPIDDGAAIELSWDPITNPGIEALYIVRDAADGLGQFGEMPEEYRTLTAEDIALEVGGDVVATLDPGAVRFVDQPSAEANTWRYLGFVRYAGVGLLPAAAWVVDHERVVRYDRVRVSLERLDHIGDDECDIYWEFAIAPGQGYGELQRREFRLSPQDAFEIDEDESVDIAALQLPPDAVQADIVLPRDGTGLTLVGELFSASGLGRQDRLGAQEVYYTADQIADGGLFDLEFDQWDDPGECTIRAWYRVEIVEAGVVDPGFAGLQ